jgi:hypothetical protein
MYNGISDDLLDSSTPFRETISNKELISLLAKTSEKQDFTFPSS